MQMELPVSCVELATSVGHLQRMSSPVQMDSGLLRELHNAMTVQRDFSVRIPL